MSRDESLDLLKNNLSNENLFKHCLAVEAIMKGIASYLNEEEEMWAICGLLHDIDYERTKDDHKNHGLVAEEILKDKVSDEVMHAIKSHNFENTGVNPESKIDFALIAADAVSGLVIASALIQPSKKLEDVKVKSIKKKFKQKDFARNCNRENMLLCEKLGIEKEKFFEISLNSMKTISEDLGL
ncbi:MAG: HDIG domain-containing protein [Candidatus Woesearchaeota archaeon]|nr:MAG: HDIG domain-containing protein [Candidatus Woesearchaeota archaeon]